MSGLLLYDAQPQQIPRCYDTGVSRIMVMGDTGSGKTSFILRCVNGTYRDIDSGVYMEDIYRRALNLPLLLHDPAFQGDHDVQEFLDSAAYDRRALPKEVDFLDAAPFEIADFSELRNQQILQSDAFLLCFDTTSEESLLNLRTYQRRIERVRGIDDNVPILIVATKADMLSERKVGSPEILETMARFELPYEHNFFEVSSKHNTNVKSLFVKALIMVEKYKYQQRYLAQQQLEQAQEQVPEQPQTPIPTPDSSSPTSDTDIGPVASNVQLIHMKDSGDIQAPQPQQQSSRPPRSKSHSSRSIIISEKTDAIECSPTEKRTATATPRKQHSDSCCVIC